MTAERRLWIAAIVGFYGMIVRDMPLWMLNMHDDSHVRHQAHVQVKAAGAAHLCKPRK